MIEKTLRRARFRSAIGIAMACASLLSATAAQATPAETLGVQGRFLTPSGQPVPDGNYSVTVSFYTAQAAVSPLYFETQPSVAVKGGLFSIQAGSVKPLNTVDFKSGDATWVGLKIAAEAELPRLPLKFVPYALRAQSVDPTVLTPYAKTSVLATTTMLPPLNGVPCGSGLVVKGFNTNGSLNCIAASAYSAGTGLTLTGSSFALAPPTTLALGGVLSKACVSPQAVTGVDTAGNLICGNAGLITTVTGTAPITATTVGGAVTVGLGTVPVGSGGTGLTAPGTAGFYLRSNGTSWTTQAIAAADIAAGTAPINVSGSAASFTGALVGDVTGLQGATVVGKLQGRTVATTAPANGQVLTYNTATSNWGPAAPAGGAANTSGSGTVGYLARWTSAAGLGNGLVYDTGTNVGVGTASPSEKLHVAGNVAMTGGSLRVGSNATGPGSADGNVSIGSIATDSSPTSGNWTTATTLILSGLNYSAIGFHDAGNRVDFIRTGAGTMTFGYDGGWGTAKIAIPNLGGSGTAFVQTDNAGNLTPATAPTVSGLSFTAPPGDPAPTISARTIPVGQGNANERTELILFHSNDPDNGSGADVITLRAPGLRFQTYNNATVSDINNNAGSNDRMYISPTGNVGIGTSTPQTTLHVEGDLRGKSSIGGAINVQTASGYLQLGAQNSSFAHLQTDRARFYFNAGVTVDTGNISSYSQDLSLQTAGTTQLTVKNGSGYVGIGTASPGFPFAVERGNPDWQSHFGNGGGAGGADVYLAHGGGYGMHLRGWNASDSVYTLEMYNNSAKTNVFFNSGRVGLGLAGNVGVGTASPGEKLDVAGNMRASGTIAAGGALSAGGTISTPGSVYWGDSGFRTEYQDDAGLQSGRSGFFQSSAPAPASNWYSGASGWQHLLSVHHTNPANNFALQIAGSFFDQNLWFRKTNNNPAQAWSRILTTSGGVLPMAGNDSTRYGPNSTWGAYLTVGGNGHVNSDATVATTNGNLHLDGAVGGYGTYLNWYATSTNGVHVGNGAGAYGLLTADRIGLSSQAAPGGVALRTAYLDLHHDNGSTSDRPYFRGLADHLILAPRTTGSSTMYLSYPGDMAGGTTVNTRIQESLFIGATGAGGGGNVGINTASPAVRLEVKGGHVGTLFRLNSDEYSQGLTGPNTANLNLWASEPGLTWNGAGIGNNIVNYTGVAQYPTRVATNRGGSYMRLLDNQINMNVVNSGGGDVNVLTLNAGALGLAGNLNFGPANPYISAGSYFVAPGGAYFNSQTVYFEAPIQVRAGIQNDQPSYGGDVQIHDALRVGGNITCINGWCPNNTAVRLTPNLHLNAYPGHAVYINWDSYGTTGYSATMVVANGYGGQVFAVLGNGIMVSGSPNQSYCYWLYHDAGAAYCANGYIVTGVYYYSYYSLCCHM